MHERSARACPFCPPPSDRIFHEGRGIVGLWERHPLRSISVARAVYLRLPPGSMLWQRGDEFAPIDRPALTRSFAEARSR